jgi:hypothetical protein
VLVECKTKNGQVRLNARVGRDDDLFQDAEFPKQSTTALLCLPTDCHSYHAGQCLSETMHTAVLAARYCLQLRKPER